MARDALLGAYIRTHGSRGMLRLCSLPGVGYGPVLMATPFVVPEFAEAWGR